MTLKRSLIALSAATVFGLAGCSSGGGGAGSSPVRLSIGSAADPIYASVLMADRKGLFEDAGIEVEIVQTEGGPAPTQALIAGQSDIAMNSEVQVLSLSAENEDLRALGGVQSSSRYLKAVVRDGVDPESIETVGHAQGLSLLSIVRYLESVGVDPEGVEFVDAGAPDLPALMGRGDIDATVMWEPWAANAAEAGGTVEAASGDFGVSFSQWLAVKDDWLADHAEDSAKVFEAIGKANAMVSNDPAEAAKVAASYGPVDPESYEALLREFDWETEGLGEDDVAYGEEITSFLAGRNLIASGAVPSTLILVGWFDENVN